VQWSSDQSSHATYYTKDYVYALCNNNFTLLQSHKINIREYRRGNKNGQSREAGNVGYTRRRKTKQKHNTIIKHFYL